MSEDDQKLISVSEFCGILLIGRNTAYKLLNSGYIHGAWKIGRIWKIPKRAVNDYINENIKSDYYVKQWNDLAKSMV